LIEGEFEKATFTNEEEAIQRGAEMGFVSYIANKKNIQIASNDPSPQKCIPYIKNLSGKDFTFLYFVLRVYKSVQKNKPEEKISQLIDRFKKNSLWDSYDYSFRKFKKIFKKILGEGFSPQKNYTKHFNPNLKYSRLNFATYQLNILRDNFTMQKIFNSLIKYKRIFIIKGSHHLLNCQKELDNLFYGKNI